MCNFFVDCFSQHSGVNFPRNNKINEEINETREEQGGSKVWFSQNNVGGNQKKDNEKKN